MIIKTNGDDYPTAQCDAPRCKEVAPKPGEWFKLNPGKSWPGWNKLGWRCAGGAHLCPKHAPKAKA